MNSFPVLFQLQNTKICLSGSQATSTSSLASSTLSSQSKRNKDEPHVEQKNKGRKEDFKKMKKQRKKSGKQLIMTSLNVTSWQQ